MTLVALMTPTVGMAASPAGAGNNTEYIGKKPAEISSLDVVALVEAGHAPDKAYLKRDYTAQDPTSRVYRLLDGGEALIVSGLPHATTDGRPIDTTWSLNSGSWGGLGADFYESGNNFFWAEVRGEEVKVWSSGGKRLFWDPMLYVGGERVRKTSGPFLLEDDPLNPNYEYNSLMWVYGDWECVRYIRLIEGQLQEFWRFDSNPGGEVRIDHRRSGNYPLGMGVVWDSRGTMLRAEVQYLDDEVVAAEEFDKARYPVYVGASATFYTSDPGGVDGMLAEWDDPHEGDAWATLRNGDGETASTYGYFQIVGGWGTYPSANTYDWIVRSIYLLDTSDLNDGATVTAGTFALHGMSKFATLGDTPSLNLYQTTTIYDDDVVAGDYDGISTTPLSATAFTMSTWSTTGYNTWTLNAAGLSAINKTGVTKIGARETAYDVGNVIPNWGDGYYGTTFAAFGARKGEGYLPTLVVTYTVADPDIAVEAASEVAGTTARLNSVVVDDGGEGCGVRFGYGTTSQTELNFAAYDTITTWAGSYEEGSHPLINTSGLDLTTTYYYRAQIRNAISTQTSANEESFTTTSVPTAPTDIVFFEGATSISFDWVKGAGSSYTVLRFSTSDYPAAITGGAMAANTTHSDFVHEGLAMGTRYYYSFFAGTAGNTSADYATVMVTTSVEGGAGEQVYDDPSMGEGYYDDPDATGWPARVRTGFYAAADSMNMSRNVFSTILGTFLAILVGLALMRYGDMVGMLGSIGLLILFGTMGVIPMQFAGFAIFALLAFGGLSKLAGGRSAS